MPYFVYRISSKKELELINRFEAFKDAKTFAREQRTSQAADDDDTIKIMFAENTEQAEKELLRHREAPILMEHEK